MRFACTDSVRGITEQTVSRVIPIYQGTLAVELFFRSTDRDVFFLKTAGRSLFFVKEIPVLDRNGRV